MAKTHCKHVGVFLDDSGGTLQDISAYINNISPVGLKYDEQDMSAWSDGSKNVVIGQPEAPLELSGPWDSVIHAQMIAINGRNTPLTLDIRIGLAAAWQAGNPQFGITSSATSGYVMSNYQVDLENNTWKANLNVFGPVAPAFGTAAEV